MRVTIRLFGRLHDLAGAAVLERDLAAGASVGDAWRLLAVEFPQMAAYGGSVSAAVNEDFARMSAVLSEGDEVAFLPPVSGGRPGISSPGISSGVVFETGPSD